MRERKVLAYIPVKEKSVRLPGKNILPFGESNLLTHKVRQLKRVGSLSEIVVSTDSKRMLKIAKEEGVIAMERPKKLAMKVVHIQNLYAI